ncbi:MFS transporter [Dongia soli]|uniref:MFS transporter n=1 Tax=Dongia soli TaxID=600628 RepID=A0ABU5EG38_9PROT|nr:MFS transporter [Dongia soli]MDY0885192.1 MFS transporter [Dongia soli]
MSSDHAACLPSPHDDCRNTPRADIAAWAAVLSIAVGSFVMVTTEFLPIGLLTDIAAGLRVSDGTAGLMVTMPAAAAAIAAPTLIMLSGGLDRRYVLWALMGLLIVSNSVAALAPSFPVLLIGRVLLGICVGGFWSFATNIGRRLVPEVAGSRAVALVLAGISVGTVCGVPAGALIGDLFGWRAAFGLTAGFTALVLLSQILLLPPLPAQQAVGLRHLFAPLRWPMARIGYLVCIFLFIGQFAAYTYLKPLLQQVIGLAPDYIALLLLVYGLTGIVATFIGERATARSLGGAMIGITVILGLTVIAAPHATEGQLLITALVGLWGFAFGAIPVAITNWMFKAVPDNPEAGQGLLVSVVQVALSSGALVGGLLVDHAGIVNAMTAAGSLVLVGGLITALFARRF